MNLVKKIISQLGYKASLSVNYLDKLKKEGKQNEVELYLRELINTDYKNESVITELGSLLVQNSRIREAEDLFTNHLQVMPGSMVLLKQLVKNLDDQNRTSEAEEWQRWFLERNRDNSLIIATLMSRLNRLWRYEEAIGLGEQKLNEGAWSQQTFLQLVRAYINGRGASYARQRLFSITGKLKIDTSNLVAYSELLTCEGKFDEALTQLRNLDSNKNNERFVSKEVCLRLQKLEVFQVTRRIIESVNINGSVRGLTVLVTHGSPLAHLWMIPLATEMRKQGFATVILERNSAPVFASCGIREIDDLHGILDANRARLNYEDEGFPKLRRDWLIDLDNEKVEADGINIFREISARIGTKLRCYRFDRDHALARSITEESIHRADAALSVCEYIHKNIASKGMPVRFMAGMSHYSPATVYRKYCQKHRDEVDMEYIAFVAGYQHYYTNLRNNISTALSIENMTRHPELNLPSRVTRKNFENWMKKLDNKDELIAETMKIISFDRAGRAESEEAFAVRKRIEAHRAASGKVACLFGKILYDLWMDEPGGPAHGDIIEWLNHTINIVRNTNTLLLIKPHPNEIKQIIARPAEKFFDLINTDLNNNVILLDHTWFNMDGIASMIDIGLVWTGTSALELQASGIPVVISSYWGVKDHPVKFIVPENRQEYESILKNPGNYKLDENTKLECALLIKYYSTDEVMIPHHFGVMPYLRGVDVGGVRWNDINVESFIRNGDPHVWRLAHRVI